MGELTRMDEEELWWELDKIAVSESAKGNHEKADAAGNLIKYLKAPSHMRCKELFERDGGE